MARQPEEKLPPLRDDLEITPGAPFLSGAPSWVVYDPVRHRFFQVGERTIEILSRWSAGTVTNLRVRLLHERMIRLNEVEYESFRRFLLQHNLLEGGEPGTAKRFVQAESLQKNSWIRKAAQNFLFVRVPLFRPNAWLEQTWPFVSPFFSRNFVWITTLVFFLSLYLVNRQVSDLQDYLRSAFTWAGAASYALAIVLVKILHELGHAYQAISRRLRVPVMGVAFFVMLPLLYTDVTDAWRLRSRRDRIMVDLGGVMVELTVAVYATFSWCFLPDGPVRAIAFAMATSSWILSLLVNLNPLMRFDGYFLLSDALGMHNLQPRAFAIGKWALRSFLFGLSELPPEDLSSRTRRFFTFYAMVIWIYRFFLFLGISILVYTFAFKALGICLFLLTITMLIIVPAVRELNVWFGMRRDISKSPRAWTSATLALTLVFFSFYPVSYRIHVPAILEESRQQLLFPPASSKLEKVFVVEGQHVRAGDPLFQFSDPDLPVEITRSKIRLEMFNARLQSIAGDDRERAESTVTTRLIDEEMEALSALRDRESNLLLRASMNGVVRELPHGLVPETWFDRKQLLGRIIDRGHPVFRGYVSEVDRVRIDRKRQAVFVAEEMQIPVARLENIELSEFFVENLTEGYLAKIHGGTIPVLTEGTPELVTDGIWFPVDASPAAPEDILGLSPNVVSRGTIIFRSVRISFSERIGRRIAQVLVRESGL